MIGQATASLHRPAKALFHRLWGVPDVHTRQKWGAVWKHLSKLPPTPLRVLDAGCGEGLWALEIGRRRPNWSVTGIDRLNSSVQVACERAQRLKTGNVNFSEADFLRFSPPQPFDVVLSVASAHYLVSLGRGQELFARFRDWLKPGGLLILLGPRAGRETPYLSALPKPEVQPVFERRQLIDLSEGHQLGVVSLRPLGSAMSAAAKQLAILVRDSHPVWKALAYPAAYSLSLADTVRSSRLRSKSVFWVLVAARNE